MNAEAREREIHSAPLFWKLKGHKSRLGAFSDRFSSEIVIIFLFSEAPANADRERRFYANHHSSREERAKANH